MGSPVLSTLGGDMTKLLPFIVTAAILSGCGTSTESRVRNLVCVGFCAQQDGERAAKETPKPESKELNEKLP